MSKSVALIALIAIIALFGGASAFVQSTIRHASTQLKASFSKEIG